MILELLQIEIKAKASIVEELLRKILFLPPIGYPHMHFVEPFTAAMAVRPLGCLTYRVAFLSIKARE